MLLTIDKWGGLAPRIKDPALLPVNKSQTATNATFDEGGVHPIRRNLFQELMSSLTESIFRYYGDGSPVFFSWLSDVDAIKAPLAGDVYGRVFYTEAGKHRVTDKTLYKAGGTAYPMSSIDPSPPQPAAAPVIAGTPTGTDPTLIETRGYVYTYVNSYGAEGPPSLVSNLLDIYDGDTVNISGMSTAPSSDYDIVYKRIYRLNQSSGGYSQYQFVDEIAVADTTYADTTLSSALSEVLASTEWDGAPAGMAGLISLPNGVCAGFVGNRLCLSVSGYPHAWPVAYQKVMDYDIVGLGAFGTTVVVLTEGTPYVNVGNDPANTVTERVQGFSCLSKVGIVQAGEVVVYPCSDGLMAIGPVNAELITWDIITPDQWYEQYAPATIRGFYWQAKYIGFYRRVVDGVTTLSGFMFDLKTKDLVPLDFYATAGFYDKADGTLYLVVDGELVCFAEEVNDKLDMDVAPTVPWMPGEIIVGETSRATATVVGMVTTLQYNVTGATGDFLPGEVIGVDTNTADQGAGYPVYTPKNRTLLYKTKKFLMRMNTFGAIKIIADEYPVNVDITYPKISQAVHKTLYSSKPGRIKPYLADEVEITVHGQGLSIIMLAASLEELPV